MAQDAVTLTVLGHRQWNPDVDLFGHLCGVIWSESSGVAAHAKKFRHASVETLAMDGSRGGDKDLDAADRFAQHCHRVKIIGTSWRDKHRLSPNDQPPPSTTPRRAGRQRP